MRDVYRLISRVAQTSASVLVTGETGTGKELVAATVHALSRRRGPFVPVNCGALSAHVVESELFGHERGSFTGADRTHKGHFEQAHGGTLFLDEIAETPLDLQVKLLRTLESGEITRVGGMQPIPTDVRLVAATNRRPAAAMVQGQLRRDLFYRLNVFPIHVPPLRERGGDAELLATHFLNELNAAEGTAKKFSLAFRPRLARYTWPGNVRELKNLVARAFILADDALDIDPGGPAAGDAAALGAFADSSIADMERTMILSTLLRFGGDEKKAIAVLKISLKTLHNRLHEYRT